MAGPLAMSSRSLGSNMKRIIALLTALLIASPALLPSVAIGAPNSNAPNIPPSAPGFVPSLQVANVSVTAKTRHDEIVLSDAIISAGSTALASASATFTPADVGKVIILDGLGAAGADLQTTITGYTDSHHVTIGATTTFAAPWYTIGRALVSNPTAVSASYAPGDTLTPTGGTSSTTGVFTITSTTVGSATVNAGGSGGANGACTVMGTTGVTRSNWASGTSNYKVTAAYFTATGTVSGGALTGALTVTQGGDYTTAPTSLSAEPVIPISGCSGLTGATVTLKMAPYFLTQTTAGHYTSLPGPTNVATTTSGSGSGAVLTLWGLFQNGNEGAGTTPGDQIGGFFAYGTDDTAAINAAIATCTPVQLPAGRHLVLGAIDIPWTGTTQPSMCATKIGGAGNLGVQSRGGTYVSMWTAPLSGTMLDIRYAGGDGKGHVAKVDSRGFNTLALNDLTLADYGTDNYQFVQVTNTTPRFKNVTILGNPTCYRMTCVQNGIAFGNYTGAMGSFSSSASNAPYQGYNGNVTDVNFGHIQAALQYGGSSNNVSAYNIEVDLTSGTYSSAIGAITFYGAPFGSNSNMFYGGNIECRGYPYAVVGIHTTGSNVSNSFFGGPECSDGSNTNTTAYTGPGLPTIGQFYFDANTTLSTIIGVLPDNGSAPSFVNGAGAPTTYMAENYAGVASQTPYTFSAAKIGANLASGELPGFPIKWGPGTGNQQAICNGGNSASNDGCQMQFWNNSSATFAIGNHSALVGGGYSQNTMLNNIGSGVIELASFNNIQISIGNALTAINSASLKLGSNLWVSQTTPTITSGYGTSPSIAANNTAAFKVTVGASGAPTAATVLGMPTASGGWTCTAQDQTTAITARQTANTTTSVTMTWSAAPSLNDVILYQCAAY